MGRHLGTYNLQDTYVHAGELGERCLEGNSDRRIAFEENSIQIILQIASGMSDMLLDRCKVACGTTRQGMVDISCFGVHSHKDAALLEL